jgi:threonine aldolase
MKYMFFDDYSEGAHPRILEAFTKTNLQQERGYVQDTCALEATDFIREKFQVPHAAVHFVTTGTQANIVTLASMLKPYESVIATDEGHIHTHETGGMEATGHKINAVTHQEGKLTPEAVVEVVEKHNFDQMVKPRVVYISQSTEFGSIYSKAELEALADVCKKHDLLFFLDGARLGAALASEDSDVSPAQLAELVDAFYIGGTKNGALIGEAIVLVNPDLQENFRFHLRQRGALLAKARAVTVQFYELFRDDLYFKLARHANSMAQKLAEGFRDAGYEFFVESPTNQVFPIFENSFIRPKQKTPGFQARG